MRPPRTREMLEGRVDHFTNALTELAREIVRGVLAAELERRRRAAAPQPTRRRARNGKPALRPLAALTGSAREARRAPGNGIHGRQRHWTRDAVLDELSTWLLGGTSDPAFIARHGRKGLATAAKRIFGRFDAALNAANLRLARRYPGGIPTANATRARARLPALRRGANGAA